MAENHLKRKFDHISDPAQEEVDQPSKFTKTSGSNPFLSEVVTDNIVSYLSPNLKNIATTSQVNQTFRKIVSSKIKETKPRFYVPKITLYRGLHKSEEIRNRLSNIFENSDYFTNVEEDDIEILASINKSITFEYNVIPKIKKSIQRRAITREILPDIVALLSIFLFERSFLHGLALMVIGILIEHLLIAIPSRTSFGGIQFVKEERSRVLILVALFGLFHVYGYSYMKAFFSLFNNIYSNQNQVYVDESSGIVEFTWMCSAFISTVLLSTTSAVEYVPFKVVLGFFMLFSYESWFEPPVSWSFLILVKCLANILPCAIYRSSHYLERNYCFNIGFIMAMLNYPIDAPTLAILYFATNYFRNDGRFRFIMFIFGVTLFRQYGFFIYIFGIILMLWKPFEISNTIHLSDSGIPSFVDKLKTYVWEKRTGSVVLVENYRNKY